MTKTVIRKVKNWCMLGIVNCFADASVQAKEGHSDSEKEESPCDNVVDEAEVDTMEVDEETNERLKEKVGKFDWLVGFFRTELLNES